MDGRHQSKNSASGGGSEPRIRAYPQANRVYVSPDYEPSRDWDEEEDYGRTDRDWEEYDRYYGKPRRKRSLGRLLLWMIPLLIVLTAAAVMVGSLVSTAGTVAELDTIFPNVYINGVNVGGLTPAEALQKLEDVGADPYKDTSVTVRFPDDTTLVVTAEEMGLDADPLSAIEEAYTYGRSGNLLKDVRAYRAALRSPVNISWTEEVQLADESLREKLAAAAEEIELDEVAGESEIGEEGVTLVKSRGSLTIDVDGLCTKVKNAFLTRNFAEIAVEPEVSGEEMTEEEAEAMLLALYDEIHVEAKDAAYDTATGGVTESVRGVSFDVEDALSLWTAAQPGETIFIPFVFTEPEIDSETLNARLFVDCLAEKSTSLYGSSSARINNINLAAQSLNGTVVNPGETFDYNTCLGQRTAARGYQEAGAYSGGRHVTEVGGGICQGSSTLYYCALLANMTITVRDCHYFTVSYLPMGFDATVSWGGPDFRFMNSRSYPIKIRAWVSDGYLTVQIWGTSDGTRVDLSHYDTWEDAEYYYAQTYRYVYAADGSLLSSAAEAYSRYHKYESGTEVTATPAPTTEVTPTPEPVITPEPVTPEPVITPVPVTPEPVITPEPVLTPEPMPEPIPEPDPVIVPEPVPEPLPEGE